VAKARGAGNCGHSAWAASTLARRHSVGKKKVVVLASGRTAPARAEDRRVGCLIGTSVVGLPGRGPSHPRSIAPAGGANQGVLGNVRRWGDRAGAATGPAPARARASSLARLPS